MNASFVMGDTAENKFKTLAEKRKYHVASATKKENIESHIDFHLTANEQKLTVDVKAQKRIHRNGSIQDDWIPIEFIAVTYPVTNKIVFEKVLFDPLNPNFHIGSGRAGWIYGQSTHIAFEMQYAFLLVKREDILLLCTNSVNFSCYCNSAKEAKYKVYTRPDRGDLITFIHKNDLTKIQHDVWRKSIYLKNFCL